MDQDQDHNHIVISLSDEETRALLAMMHDTRRPAADYIPRLIRAEATRRALLAAQSPPMADTLTDGVLSALTEAARRYGHEGDYEEVAAFVRWCYAQAGRESPDLEPYERDG